MEDSLRFKTAMTATTRCTELASYLEQQFPDTKGHILLQLRIDCIANELAKSNATIAELTQLLAHKNETANVFMNQIRKLQAKEAQMEALLRDGIKLKYYSHDALDDFQAAVIAHFPSLAQPKR
jgi:hypothetical protein